MTSKPPTLGTLLKGIRAREGLTLRQMSDRSGIPVSTLSKIEHDRLTLSYDKLQQLSRRLGMRMADLFAETDQQDTAAITARRSIGSQAQSVRVETPNYDYYYLCTELRKKRMIPVLTKIRAHSPEEFGELVKHSGEEFIFVLKGKVTVRTEFYDAVTLSPGESIYIDSTMGHAYLTADEGEEAEVLAVMSSSDEELMNALLSLHEEQRQSGAPSRSMER